MIAIYSFAILHEKDNYFTNTSQAHFTNTNMYINAKFVKKHVKC